MKHALITLHPLRTLIEKLSFVNSVANELAKDPITVRQARVGRHLYDIHQLLSHNETKCTLEDRDQFLSIVTECEVVSSKYFDDFSARPEGGYANSLAFTADNEQIDKNLRRAYENTAVDLRLGEKEWPRWEEIQQIVSRSARLL